MRSKYNRYVTFPTKRLLFVGIALTTFGIAAIAIAAYHFDTIFIPKESRCDSYYDYFIQRLEYEQRQYKLERDGTDVKMVFDADAYFKIFDHLTIKKGWGLDCYYYRDKIGSSPYVYVRKLSNNKDSLLRTLGNRGIFRYSDSIALNKYVVPTDSKKGLFQLLVLELLGSNFAEGSHFMYSHVDIISSKRAMKRLMKVIDFDPKVKKRIKNIDFTISSKDYRDSVTYRWVVFTAWGGFYEDVFSINKKTPYTHRRIKRSHLEEYDCGILF
ncbi:hypothetical protein [uncultured Acetobacteroides sp.]|uniref:hypothetical protein n=1 Tax=uncultured Acetobacteroides sp. TaxID=1760811 RepID=UPI0029F49382|nr:hypothetical protein [uncultured Acetobacteroides sp.]